MLILYSPEYKQITIESTMNKIAHVCKGWGYSIVSPQRPEEMAGEMFYEDPDLLVMPLHAFVERFGTKLPQVVAVNESRYGECGGSLSEGQHLKVYFKKETKVVNLMLSPRNYVVPVCSQLKASVLYNPHNNLEKAKEGYYFATVADLIKAVPQPSVVSVGKNWTSSKDLSLSLQKGQILIIKGVDSLDRKGRMLNCIDTVSNAPVCLENTCKGHFTTQPSLIAIDMRLLVEHFQLPIQAFFHHDDTKGNNAWFQNEVGNITKQYLLQSIIAVPRFSKRNQYDDIPRETLEIFTTLPINVKIVEVSEEDRKKMITESQRLAKVLKPSLLSQVVADVSLTMNSFLEGIFKSIPEKEWRNDVQHINEGVPKKKKPPPPPESPKYLRKQTLAKGPIVNSMSPTFPSFNRPVPNSPPVPPKPKQQQEISTTDNPCYECLEIPTANRNNDRESTKQELAGNELLLKDMQKSISQLTARLESLENAIKGKKYNTCTFSDSNVKSINFVYMCIQMFSVSIEKRTGEKRNKGVHYEENSAFLKTLSVVEVMFNFYIVSDMLILIFR